MKSIHNQLANDMLDAYAARDRNALPAICEKTIAAGTTIVHQDVVPKNVYLILQGSMRVHLGTPKGTDYLVAMEGAGEIVGEVEALAGEPAACSVTAMQESTVAVMPVETYGKWLEIDHDFALIVNRIICRRLQLFTKRAAIHLSYPMEYSVLKLLEMTARETDSSSISLSKEEIASYLATSVRSINRILNDLQKKGIIDTAQGIEIISMDNLESAMRVHDE